MSPRMNQTLILATLLTLWSSSALAGEFVLAEHGFYIIDFLIIMFVIKKMGAKPLNDFLVNRRDTISTELDEAKRLHAEATARLDEYDTKLGQLDDERKRILEGFLALAESEKARILMEAEEQAKRLVTDAQARIEQETSKLTRALEVGAVEMAISLATKRVSNALDAQGHANLVGDALASIEKLDQGDLVAEQH